MGLEMRVVLLALVLGMLGCPEKRKIREWRPDDHDQPEDETQVEGGEQAPAKAQGQARRQAQQEAPQQVARTEEPDGGAVSVEMLWREQCQRCHARDGSGRTSMAQRMPVADLRESELTEDQIVRIVTKGRREMPSFAEDLDPASIRALARKVISLRGGDTD